MRSRFCVIFAALLCGASAASAEIVERTVETPAFEHKWGAITAGAIAASNAFLVVDGRHNAPLAIAGIGAGVLLAPRTGGKFCDLLGAVSFLCGFSQALGSKPGDRPRARAFQVSLVGGPRMKDGHLRHSLALDWRW